jgi:predicted nuclease with TOPRIM domain
LGLEDLVALRRDLAESKILLDQHTKTIQDLTHEKESLDKKKAELDARCGNLEQEYEELLDKTIAEEEVAAQKNEDMEETIATLKVICPIVYLMIVFVLTLLFTEQNGDAICHQERGSTKRNRGS